MSAPWKESVFEAFRSGPVTEAQLADLIHCRKGQAITRLRILGWPVRIVGNVKCKPKGRPRLLYSLENM